MPVNKNALARYQTIDRCLCNRQRKWTLDDLIAACTKAVQEFDDSEASVSRRTVQLDIQQMRSGKLGYAAPIVVLEKKYYTYESPEFSIFSLPVSELEMDRLSDAVDVMKQFSGFSHFEELGGLIKKLEDKIEVTRKHRQPVISFDKNQEFHGLKFLDEAYQAILSKKVLKVSYQPFGRESPYNTIIHPYLLKEFNSRWYLVGFSDFNKEIINLGLERVIELQHDARTPFIENNFFKPDLYFRDVIGVTVDLDSDPVEVLLFVIAAHAPYILTKPLHPSQKIVVELEEGVVISLFLRINFELRAAIRSFGSNVTVIKPKRLALQLMESCQKSLRNYQDAALKAKIWRLVNQERT